MTTQIYTATAGPADPKAKIRQYRYTAAAVITAGGPALALALAQGGVSKWIAFAVAIGGVLTGTLENANAARKVSEQRKDGTFDAAPEPLPSPVDQIINSVPVVIGTATAALDDLGRVREATEQLGGLAKGLPNIAGSLTEMLIDLARADRNPS